MVQLSHPYMTTGKTIALTVQTSVGKMMSLLFNTLSRFVIAFLPRSKCVLILWLQLMCLGVVLLWLGSMRFLYLWVYISHQIWKNFNIFFLHIFFYHPTLACQASLSSTISWSLLKPMSTESVMLSNHLSLWCPLFLLPSVFPSIRVFSSESALRIRWPKYWSFSFSISPSSEYSELISFRIDWFDLLSSPRDSQQSSPAP